MTSIGLELGIIVLLILFNGVLAMSELAIVSARKIRLQQRAEEGDAGGVAVALAEAGISQPSGDGPRPRRARPGR
jgi:CBS domain containing-hemolysin-like protein